ncbi:hypothetical protein ACO1MK_14930, partial [Staphylococcus aureus]
DMYMIDMINKKQRTHKEIVSKGGLKRSNNLYGPAKQYTQDRYKQLLSEDPTISMRQAARIIEAEAYDHPSFAKMSEGNA